jgi:hypothetical protein
MLKRFVRFFPASALATVLGLGVTVVCGLAYYRWNLQDAITPKVEEAEQAKQRAATAATRDSSIVAFVNQLGETFDLRERIRLARLRRPGQMRALSEAAALDSARVAARRDTSSPVGGELLSSLMRRLGLQSRLLLSCASQRCDMRLDASLRQLSSELSERKALLVTVSGRESATARAAISRKQSEIELLQERLASLTIALRVGGLFLVLVVLVRIAQLWVGAPTAPDTTAAGTTDGSASSAGDDLEIGDARERLERVASALGLIVHPWFIRVVLVSIALAPSGIALLTHSPRWLIAHVATIPLVFALFYAIGREGYRHERFSLRLSGQLAGATDGLVTELSRQASFRTLGEDACKHLAILLLSRLKEVVAFWLSHDERDGLRAALIVPIRTTDGTPQSVRVWCYDSPYADRRWSTFLLNDKGAGECFTTGSVTVLDNVNQSRTPAADRRSFAAVICFPVKVGGTNGKTVAVVSIDSQRPKHFSIPRVARKLYLQTLPILGLIALLITARQAEVEYEFK